MPGIIERDKINERLQDLRGGAVRNDNKRRFSLELKRVASSRFVSVLHQILKEPLVSRP